MFRLAGVVESGDRVHRLEQEVMTGPPIQRRLLVDGAEVDIEHYLQIFPIFAITGSDRDLISGEPVGAAGAARPFPFPPRRDLSQ